MPTNLTSSFTVMRHKIEKLVEEGLTFKPDTKDSPQKLSKDEMLMQKSPLEVIYYEKEMQRIQQEEN